MEANTTERIKDKLSATPESPGVYLMKDAKGRIIYVGKAKRLRDRLRSYFNHQQTRDMKTQALVAEIGDFDVIITQSEVDALLAERSLIKHHKPYYNILLQDDKEYPLLRIDLSEPWPRLEKVRRRKADGALYLGPFGSASQLRSMLDLTYRIFPLVRCSRHEFAHAKRPCTYYHMHLCLAPCTLPVLSAEYLATMQHAIEFLNGRNRQVAQGLKVAMEVAAREERYEAAARHRDQLRALAAINEKQTIMVSDVGDVDAIGLHSQEGLLVFLVMMVRDGILYNQESFVAKTTGENPEQALPELLMQYYDSRIPPAEILVPVHLEDATSLAQALGKAHQLPHVPIIRHLRTGPKAALVNTAQKNAAHSGSEHTRIQATGKIELQIVAERLKLTGPPTRMECIDISNLQGTSMVASNVCFLEGKPAKHLYRLYNLQTIDSGPDDYASIAEVVRRRLQRAQDEGDTPDLLIIDGGKGQLAAALGSASAFPDLRCQFAALAKSRRKNVRKGLKGEEHYQTGERIFLPGVEGSLLLRVGSPEYRLLVHLRNEAHRFAITRHRAKRKRVLHGSILEQVPGVGPRLRERLLKHFGSLESLRQADLETLTKVQGISTPLAKKLHDFLKIEDPSPELP